MNIAFAKNQGLPVASKGQSLIETITAVAILAMGIVGGLSLAIYAIGSSETTLNQIIAANLAREGVEVVRNMRDTNWMQDSLAACGDIGAGQQCYSDWLNQAQNIRGSSGGGQEKRVEWNPSTNSWSISNANGSRFRLYPDSGASYVHDGAGDPRFYRKIAITRDEAAPFTSQNPRLKVVSTVWWKGGPRCPAVNDAGATTCKVVAEEHLTNWRNY